MPACFFSKCSVKSKCENNNFSIISIYTYYKTYMEVFYETV